MDQKLIRVHDASLVDVLVADSGWPLQSEQKAIKRLRPFTLERRSIRCHTPAGDDDEGDDEEAGDL